ncbi:MAG: HoxN/HupN/NixA family nickel/cobalt transporter [Acetobacteraceae bacterium]|nr:HoxN/HupN/NixA family nickel/cobalt transporter [Acetobacteraceae bacterium]
MTQAPQPPDAITSRRLWLTLIGANLLAWVWAWMVFGDTPALLGTALLAWMLGLRHAVDADHIAAIDNVTRGLLHRAAHQQVGHVGLYFSLGHSTVVFLAAFLIAGSASEWQDRLHGIKDLTASIGTGISVMFLLLIAVANLAILRGIWRDYRHLRASGAEMPRNAQTPQTRTGPMARGSGTLLRKVGKSWHMYPLGLVFGLGFDTATEIGLLSLAASQTAPGLSPWQILAHILVFPALFTAAMALVDTADTLLMVRAYGWAFTHPLRKLWYNLAVTAASVIVALLIATITTLDRLGEIFALDSWIWRGIAGLNENMAGFGILIVGIFVLFWAVSATVYRRKAYAVLVERI